jgi:hypothetical protein
LRTIFSHISRSTYTSLWKGTAVDDELEARLFDRRSKHARELRRETREVGRLEIGVDAARLDPREIEQRVHEPQESQGIAMRHLLARSMHRRQWRFCVSETVLERAHQQGQRCAEFVTDIAEKGRLRPIELRQGLGAVSLLLVGAGVGKCRAELIRHQVNEAGWSSNGRLGLSRHQSCGLPSASTTRWKGP